MKEEFRRFMVTFCARLLIPSGTPWITDVRFFFSCGEFAFFFSRLSSSNLTFFFLAIDQHVLEPFKELTKRVTRNSKKTIYKLSSLSPVLANTRSSSIPIPTLQSHGSSKRSVVVTIQVLFFFFSQNQPGIFFLEIS